MIEARQLQYTYAGGGQVLQFPDISCGSREKLLITGPSGSGKTTLLHLLAGLRLPQKGEVKVKGESLTNMSSAARDRFRGQQIGIVFQQMHFVHSLNVLENIMLPQYTAGLRQDAGRAESLLEQLGLLAKKNKNIRHLSQGEQQRVAIARALVNKPALLLADEPTSSLDDADSQRVIRLLEEMATREEAALLVVTHDQRLKDVFSQQIAL
ncbi:ABC transporter ATP-binding protein [Nafulsella turpanensis]|uniref:ABC transporter ATP-binding protein n=1 Tax=Nafulsella turpanensis TaxID=1265690 RepID=UPI00034DB781|nr:ATP-binding cassette domain-containing protein [Nafulsella turpanensis]